MNFNEIEVGQKASIHVRVSKGAIAAFGMLVGDLNPVHGQIAHGMLIASYVSRLVGMELPGPGSVWAEQSFEWLWPVTVGDELDITLIITHKSKWTRAVRIKVEAANQDRLIVMGGKGIVIVPGTG